MDTRRDTNRARARTQRDFNDLSTGIRRVAIDTGFHPGRSMEINHRSQARWTPEKLLCLIGRRGIGVRGGGELLER